VIAWIKRSVVRRTAVVAGITTALFAAAIWQFLLSRALSGEPLEAQRRIGLVALLAGLLLVACVTLAAVLTVRRLLGTPLRRLTEAMATAEHGNFMVRAAEGSADEIGQLARAFNSLLRTITNQQVDIIDTGRELTLTRRELDLKAELAEKARIIEEQNRQLALQLSELELLFEASKTITSQLEMPKLLDTLCEQVGMTLGFEEFAILLLDEESGQLVVQATYGLPNGEAIRGMRFNPGEGVSGIVARSGEWLLIPDTSKDERYLHYKGKHLADGTFLCVPMRYQDRLVGLFNVLRQRVNAIGEGDIRLLVALGNAAALAITNAQHFHRGTRPGAVVAVAGAGATTGEAAQN
jgi:nitrate/nitrite-specific signal transduction histidine kinase